ncbi:F-box protein PP2-B10 [Musa acuminata AAA Group]|uniref:F-box protein PP2-B10 n=1 Tax=Musa acuminata AAA Group TaxID=214697 RepID=UPI0031E1489A
MGMEKRRETEGGGELARLPEECVALVLSHTSPRDSCRSALVSSAFLSAANSDVLWERFLPSDYADILSRAVHPVEYSSKKQLYIRLCDSILLDDGKVSFRLEKSTGGKCYMVSAESMTIIWGYESRYWRWVPHPESRFAKVAELLSVCWLHIRGSMNCRLLSRRTRYVVCIVFKLTPGSHGLGDPPQKASVKLGSYASESFIRLQPDDDDDDDDESEEEGEEEKAAVEGEDAKTRLREDGWMEMELGDFYTEEGDDGNVEVNLRETEGLNWKRGLIVQGLEFRPKI